MHLGSSFIFLFFLKNFMHPIQTQMTSYSVVKMFVLRIMVLKQNPT